MVMKNTIEVDEIVVALFKAYKDKHLYVHNIYAFVIYYKNKLYERNSADRIYANVSGELIERFVYFNPMVFEMQGHILFLKGVLPTIENENKELAEIAEEFVKEHPNR